MAETVKVACPNCGGHISFATADAGRLADCPSCNTSLVLSLPESVPTRIASQPVKYFLKVMGLGLFGVGFIIFGRFDTGFLLIGMALIIETIGQGLNRR